jgi:CheY-like chemotaxis protein
VCAAAPLRRSLRDQLSDWGATVKSTASGCAAGAVLARERPYDVVLVAGGEALEIVEQLREAAVPLATRLVLLTPAPVEVGASGRLRLSGQILLPVRAGQLYATLAHLAGPVPRLGEVRAGSPAGSPPPTSAAPTSERAAGPVRGRVLVAEDNAINRLVAVGLLQGLGCAVDATEDGRQAVEAVGRKAYDLVLMDLHMPEVDGFTATATIRERERTEGHGRRVPIVALTADAVSGDAEKSLAAGMDDYLSKPITPERLAAMVERWVKPGAASA